jgi:hypothetical protein
MNDGVSLISTAHPRASWYKRLWSFFFRPRLHDDAIVTEEIEIEKVSTRGFRFPSL